MQCVRLRVSWRSWQPQPSCPCRAHHHAWSVFELSVLVPAGRKRLANARTGFISLRTSSSNFEAITGLLGLLASETATFFAWEPAR